MPTRPNDDIKSRNAETLVRFVRELEESRGIDVAMREAARFNIVAELARLVKSGGSVDSLDEKGTTLLMYASLGGAAKATAWLLAQGANPTIIDQDGANALVWAMRGWHRKHTARRLITLLLQAGIDPTHCANDRITPFDLAHQRYGEEIASELRR